MRMGLFLESLAEVAVTELLVLPIDSPPPGANELADQLGVQTTVIPVWGRRDRFPDMFARLPFEALRLAAFKAYGRGTRHAWMSRAILQDIRAATGGSRYDLVHTGRLFLGDAAFAVDARRRTLDLDEDDAWAKRLRGEIALGAGHPWDAAWANAEANADDRLLKRLAGRFNAFMTSGPADACRLRQRHLNLPIDVVENAVTFPNEIEHEDDGATVLFIGTLNYAPNEEGILWFANHVWPMIVAASARPPRLVIAGRYLTPAIAALHGLPGIEIVGDAPSVAPLYARATIAIAPLFSGGGTRIKMIEAAAHGVPMVATSIAVQGLPFDEQSFLRADDAAGFAAGVLRALGSPQLCRQLSSAALGAARSRHDRAAVIARTAERFEALMSS